MHSLINQDLAHAIAAERVRPSVRGVARPRRHRPPPYRRAVAYAISSLGLRADAESARRAIG
jgi:hypothetical protein